MKGALLTTVAFLAVVAGTPACAPCFGQHRKAAKEDSFLSGPPFSFNDIAERVGVIADRRLSEAISRRGVSFTPSKADIDKLKAAGASAAILQAVTAKAPQPTRAPPKPLTAGPVHLQCQPAECDIAVNGQSKGPTEKGEITITGLPAGGVFIDFKKDGYIGQQVTATLHAGGEFSKNVILEPTIATQQALGRQLFLNMEARLGGVDALRRASLVQASGSAVLYSGGQRSDWNAEAKIKLPLLASIVITGAGLKWRTSVKAGDSKSDGTGKLKGGSIALDMEKLVRIYRDYQLTSVLRRINTMRVSSPSVMPDDAGHLTLNAASDTETYKLTLKQDNTPISVVYGSTSGLGSGLEIVYSDYAVVDNALYPKTMAIRLADQAQHGMELRFTDVRFPKSLADREFHF